MKFASVVIIQLQNKFPADITLSAGEEQNQQFEGSERWKDAPQASLNL